MVSQCPLEKWRCNISQTVAEGEAVWLTGESKLAAVVSEMSAQSVQDKVLYCMNVDCDQSALRG